MAEKSRRYWSLQRFSEEMEVSPDTVREFVKRRENPLPCLILGTSYKIPIEEARRWLEEETARGLDRLRGRSVEEAST